MKVAYKWRLDSNNYAYIIDSNGKEPFIGGLNVVGENDLKTFAGNLTESEYQENFNKMVSMVEESGFSVSFLNWKYYYDLSPDTCVYKNSNTSINNSFAAVVNSVKTGNTPDVDVIVEDNVFKFDFIVVNGRDGKDGVDGINGTNGIDGKDGIGIPSGGTDGQVLIKNGSDDYSTKWSEITIDRVDMDDYYTKDELNGRLIPTGGTTGQVVSIDDNGQIVWSKIEGGAVSTNYLETSGGTITGNLKIKNDFEVSGDTNLMGNLVVSGTAVSTGGFFGTSDLRLKNVIGKANFDVEKILNLSIIYFTFKDDTKNKQQIGVIAQEIAQICPEIVNKDEQGHLSVDYSKLSLLCLYCIKDLYGKLK